MPGGVVVPSDGPAADYGGGLTLSVFLTCLVAASGGLIFGYDIGISGAALTGTAVNLSMLIIGREKNGVGAVRTAHRVRAPRSVV
nr:unnamed protein product [Digitaria exilis]